MTKIAYKTDHEAQEIISSMKKQGAYLIEVANHRDGNYLVFSDVPNERQKSKDEVITELQIENNELKQQLNVYKSIKG